jgi:hypothetical protein
MSDIAENLPTATLSVIDRRPNPRCIAYCERLLELARSGEIVAVATVQQHSNNGIAHGWCAHTRVRQTSMVGGIAVLQHEYIDMVYNGPD